MTKTSPNPTSERDLLWAALDLPPEKRVKFLRDESKGDTALLDRLLALVQNAEAESLFMAQPAVVMDQTTPMKSEVLGTRIGRYKLMEQIGEGGMGIVYVAEQSEPVRRTVALKLIKPGMDTKQVIARFEAERQALALMDHPNIARVIDAGTTDRGLPYFVMELVRGLPITEYCDKAKLSPKDRLQLFTAVCSAVQHAHLKGIIHRDLKPNNILVTLHDGVPVVKVIDFGVAKALHQQLTQHTIYTALHQVVGTPLYMSPEQLELSGLDIDTRTDIYSLGVLLYELLTGVLPFDRDELYKSGFDEMRRIIREQDPPRPSQRITTLDEKSKSTNAMRRGLDHRSFSKSFQGEIDWIVMKALEKDRNRRYESASALAADVNRYLCDEPIQARSPTFGYQLYKLLKKNKQHAYSAAVILVGLIVMTIVSFGFAVNAGRERDKAIAAKELAEQRGEIARRAVDEMYTQVATRWLDQDGELTNVQRDFLQKAIQTYEELASLKGADSRLEFDRLAAKWQMVIIMGKLGDRQDEQLKSLIEIENECNKQLSVDPQNRKGFCILLRAQCSRARHLREMKKFSDASTVLATALVTARKLNQLGESAERPEDATSTALAFSQLGSVLVVNGNRGDAKWCRDVSLSLWRKLENDSDRTYDIRAGFANSLCNAGQVSMWWGDEKKEAWEYYDEGKRKLESLLIEFPNDFKCSQALVGALVDLGVLAGWEGRVLESAEMGRKATALATSLVKDHPNNRHLRESLLLAMNNLHNELTKVGSKESLEEADLLLFRLCDEYEKACTQFPKDDAFNAECVLNVIRVIESLVSKRDEKRALEVAERAIHSPSTMRALSDWGNIDKNKKFYVVLLCYAANLYLIDDDNVSAAKVLRLAPQSSTNKRYFDKIAQRNEWSVNVKFTRVSVAHQLAWQNLTALKLHSEACIASLQEKNAHSGSEHQDLIAGLRASASEFEKEANLALEEWQRCFESNNVSETLYLDNLRQLNLVGNELFLPITRASDLQSTQIARRVLIENWLRRPNSLSSDQVGYECAEQLLLYDHGADRNKLAREVIEDLRRTTKTPNMLPYYEWLIDYHEGKYTGVIQLLSSQDQFELRKKNVLLALCYWKTGKQDEARACLNDAYERELSVFLSDQRRSSKVTYPTARLLSALDLEARTIMGLSKASIVETKADGAGK